MTARPIAESCDSESNDELCQLFDVVRKSFVAGEKDEFVIRGIRLRSSEVMKDDDDLSVALREMF